MPRAENRRATKTMASRIPFPNRFYAAVGFAANPPLGARAVADETRLLLYALYQQATAGPCRAPKPWGWNAIESAKWSSWTQLGDTAALDAMRMYVSTMEEENPDWFSLFTDGGDPARVAEVLEAAAEAVAAVGAESELAAAHEREREAAERLRRAETVAARPHPAVDRIDGEEGAWTVLKKQIGGVQKPRGRYAHAMATVGDDVFVIGGSAGGRRLGDVFALHLPTLTWRRVNTTVSAEDGDHGGDTFPARSGHAAVSWGTKVVVVGGYHEDGGGTPGAAAAGRARRREDAEAAAPEMDAWVLDTETSEWRRLALGGTAPPARGGHTATLVRGEAEGKIVVFGGEDTRGRLLDDVRVIDLAAKTWDAPQTRGAAPAARAGHVAASFASGSRAEKDLYVFGGVSAGGAGEVSGELFALDITSMTWRELSPAGVPPVPRAGAAGAVVGEAWFIAGGGGAGGGRRDTVALRVQPSGDLEWTSAAEVNAGSSLAAEGVGVVAVGGGAALLAFGGYDGNAYSADAHVLKRPAAGRLPMTKTKMLSPVKRTVSAAETEARRDGVQDSDARDRETEDARRASDAEFSALLPRGVAEALTETRRLLSEERSKSSRLEASLAETRLQLDRLTREVGRGGASATKSPRSAEPRPPSPPRRAKGVWGFLSGDAPEYRGSTA